ncbi:hypothetical protein [Burkholderia sp. SRS-W-2-2016]|uniref:hypothetical protein n=1 Tax=Burkholderia sp. SRS-W-2-2016 TaxID=1926878 RepID=UPI000A8C4A9B|nr:hypothetical protein [Burkholderia sp. SRS-W-2-2016]
MQHPMQKKQMTAAQQVQLLHFTEIGLKWVAGQISFDDVMLRIGKPQYRSQQMDLSRYVYDYEDVMSLYFVYNKRGPVDETPHIDSFVLKVSNDVRTDMPYQSFEGLGLHRLVRGESIDGIRTERGEFFVPVGVADASRFYADNLFGFNYRFPMPPASTFDVYASLGYPGEWRAESAGTEELARVGKAVDLRKLGISRHYLTPNELDQRRLAKRQKYGAMELRSGMVCPETGMWECWTQAGVVGKEFVQAGNRFKQALHPNAPAVDARWMWSGDFAQQEQR